LRKVFYFPKLPKLPKLPINFSPDFWLLLPINLFFRIFFQNFGF